jgi:hypothetical protein
LHLGDEILGLRGHAARELEVDLDNPPVGGVMPFRLERGRTREEFVHKDTEAPDINLRGECRGEEGRGGERRGEEGGSAG